MTTTSITVNPSTWVKLTTQAAFIIQNTDKSPIKIHVTDGAAPADDTYIKIEPLDGVHSGVVAGTLYGKSFHDSVKVIVTE